jgi:predicted component of type VI protein secretion system
VKTVLDRVRSRLREVAAPSPSPAPGADGLRERIERLETMVEGLQDALYRQATSHDERFQRIERKTEPEEMARALSDDARRRGL